MGDDKGAGGDEAAGGDVKVGEMGSVIGTNAIGFTQIAAEPAAQVP
jgi:hypothetical protein